MLILGVTKVFRSFLLLILCRRFSLFLAIVPILIKILRKFVWGVKTLIIPAFVFEFLRKVFDSILYNDWQILLAYYTTHDFFTHTTLWFLYSLFLCKLMNCFLVTYMKSKTLRIGISLFVMFMGIYLHQNEISKNYFSMWQAMGSLFFVVIGNELKTDKEKYDRLIQLCTYVFPVILILMIKYNIGIPVFTGGMNVTLIQIPKFVVIATLGTFWFIGMCRYIGANRFISFFGRNSLIIYGIHFLGLQFFVYLFRSLLINASFSMTIIIVVTIYILELLFVIGAIHLLIMNQCRWIIGKW